MNEMYDLAIVGAGASGLSAGISAARCGDRVIIFEASASIGRKILASGNGRCNLMNSGELRYYGASSFAKAVLERCGYDEQVLFWRSMGLMISADPENRVYPCTFQSSSVLEALKRELKMLNVEIRLSTPVQFCRPIQNGTFEIIGKEQRIFARRVIVATGGAACSKLGGNRSGYDLLKNLGHTVKDLKPALVPLTANPKHISGLAGLRVRCSASLKDQSGEMLHQEKGEILFTDYGVSGICAMQCARFVSGNNNYLELNFSDRLFPDLNELEKELQWRKKHYCTLDPRYLLCGMIPEKLSFAVMKQAGIQMRGETLQDYDDVIIPVIMKVFTHYRIDVTGDRGMENAQVTAGGVCCDAFSAEKMESLLVPGLQAAGEILDVDGDCGGFNLMFAFGSGILAGLYGRKQCIQD